jgi:hypothetical protein
MEELTPRSSLDHVAPCKDLKGAAFAVRFSSLSAASPPRWEYATASRAEPGRQGGQRLPLWRPTR